MLAFALGLTLGACDVGAFVCDVDEDCTDGSAPGVCQPDGWCSFEDPSCPSEQRYGMHAGSRVAGSCVTIGADDPSGSENSENSGDDQSTGEFEDEGGTAYLPEPQPDLPSPDEPPDASPWLVRISLVDGVRHVFRVNTNTAETTDLCTVIDTATMLPYDKAISAVVFTRDDRLLFSSQTAL